MSIAAVRLSSIGYVKASNAEKGDRFGRAVSLSADGNTLVVGAFREDSAATGASGDTSGSSNGGGGSGPADNSAIDSGAVYIFSRNDGIWEQQAYVKASSPFKVS